MTKRRNLRHGGLSLRTQRRSRRARMGVYLAIRRVNELLQRYELLEHDWDEDYDELSCTHCGGEGYAQVDDPLWDDCDEFGYGDCPACDGSGLRSHQTVF